MMPTTLEHIPKRLCHQGGPWQSCCRAKLLSAQVEPQDLELIEETQGRSDYNRPRVERGGYESKIRPEIIAGLPAPDQPTPALPAFNGKPDGFRFASPLGKTHVAKLNLMGELGPFYSA